MKAVMWITKGPNKIKLLAIGFAEKVVRENRTYKNVMYMRFSEFNNRTFAYEGKPTEFKETIAQLLSPEAKEIEIDRYEKRSEEPVFTVFENDEDAFFSDTLSIRRYDEALVFPPKIELPQKIVVQDARATEYSW